MKNYLFIFVLLLSSYACLSNEKTSITSSLSNQSIQLTIPINNHKEYTWFKKCTPDNHIEYETSVQVGQFSFGFSIFKFPGIPEDKGDINSLLNIGQSSVWKVSNGRGELLEDHNVNIVYKDSALVISIDNPETIKLILENNPKEFEVRIIGFEHNNKSLSGQL